MRLAISNIAWDVPEDEAVARLLKSFHIDAIDIAPGKYFAIPTAAKQSDLEGITRWWRDRGIAILGMQALLFNTSGLNVFGSRDTRNATLEHMRAVCRIGVGVGAKRLVFGAPKNRDRTGLNDEQALKVGVEFFRRLGDIAYDLGVTICLEPNPRSYGANFMTTSAETAYVVRCIDHPAIRMQLDTGAVLLNEESINEVLTDCANLIEHVHISEPDLVPIGDLDTDHASLHAAIAKFIPHCPVTIEMLATKDEAHLVAIERALECVIRHYRPDMGCHA